MELLDLLLDHDRWATRRLLDASSGLTDAQLDQPFDIGHRTLRETFGHMIFNVAFWTTFLTGQPTERGYSADVQPAGRAYAAFADAARRVRDEQRLDAVFVDHYGVRKSFGGTILMVVEHNVEHRAEAQHLLIRLGVADVPGVDLGVWEYLLLNT